MSIVSMPTNDDYRDGWDRIFGDVEPEPEIEPDVEPEVEPEPEPEVEIEAEPEDEPKKKYPSQMNVAELQAECSDRDIEFIVDSNPLTKAEMRKAIFEHDNSDNPDN